MSYLKAIKKGKISQILHIKESDGRVVFLVKGLIKRFFTDDVGGSSVQMAYYILFSFFPFLIFINALVGFLNIPVNVVLEFVGRILPNEVVEMISLYLQHITKIKSPALLIMGLGMSYYSLSRGVKYLIFALHKAYRIKEGSSTIKANVISLFFTLVMFVTIIATVILMSVSSGLLQNIWIFFHLPMELLAIWDFLRFLAIGVVFTMVLALLYYLVPSRKIPFKNALPGTIVSLACIMVASIGFSFYVNNLATYSIIYGSIGTIIVFMLWLFMMGNIIIAGGEINHLLLLLQKRVSSNDAKTKQNLRIKEK